MADRPVVTPLATRLAVAFVVVALAAITVFAGLTLLAARREASGLTDRQRRDDLAAAAAAAATAYESAGDWSTADLAPAAAIAARSQATLTIVDARGNVVAAPTDQLAGMMAAMHGLAAVDTPRGEPVSAAVTVQGATVGAVMLRFPTEAMEAQRHVRDALSRAALIGGIVAIGVALVVAVAVSTRVSRPVTALTAAAGDLASGRRDAHVETAGPPELRQLAHAFNDMVDHLAREDQLRRNLVADVAHELRTPLTILQGSIEALVDGVDEPNPETLNSLHDEVTRLRRLVADLETLSAAEAAGLRLDSRPVDLTAVACDAADLLRPHMDEHGVTFRCDGTAAWTVGDPDRLHQIAINLLTNAARFTPPNGAITVVTRTADDHVVLEITDSGPGIDPGDLPHVFDRFWRAANQRGTTGSGIGLAVVKELAEAHHGTIAATNPPTGGACFTLTLPAGRPA